MPGGAKTLMQAAGVLRSIAVRLRTRAVSKLRTHFHPARALLAHQSKAVQHQARVLRTELAHFPAALPAGALQSTAVHLQTIARRRWASVTRPWAGAAAGLAVRQQHYLSLLQHQQKQKQMQKGRRMQKQKHLCTPLTMRLLMQQMPMTIRSSFDAWMRLRLVEATLLVVAPLTAALQAARGATTALRKRTGRPLRKILNLIAWMIEMHHQQQLPMSAIFIYRLACARASLFWLWN